MATTVLNINGKPETMALTCPVCKAPGPLDTKHHLYHECWATKKHRDDLHGALCAKLALRLGNPIATTLTKRMMTRPDYYSGQIGMSIKDELKKESGGEAPKLGDLHLILLHHSLEMRTLRKAAIETSTAVTKDKISVHDAHKFKIAMWAAQAAEKAAEKDTNRPSTITTTRTNTQLQQRDGRRATQRPPPPPPVRATSHNPIPRVRLEAIRGEPHQREQAATQQNLDRTPPAASPTMLHAPTSRPPRKRAQSQATPATRQRHSTATPKPATPQMPTPVIPPGPQTTAAPIVPNGATPPTHTRTLRSSKRPVEACQFTAPPTEGEQP